MVMMNRERQPGGLGAQTVPTMGAGWCPPGMLGIGMAARRKRRAAGKESLMET